MMNKGIWEIGIGDIGEIRDYLECIDCVNTASAGGMQKGIALGDVPFKIL